MINEEEKEEEDTQTLGQTTSCLHTHVRKKSSQMDTEQINLNKKQP